MSVRDEKVTDVRKMLDKVEGVTYCHIEETSCLNVPTILFLTTFYCFCVLKCPTENLKIRPVPGGTKNIK